MALYPGVNQFTHDVLQTYRYWYEQRPFTAWDPSLAPGEETIFEIQNLAGDVGPQMAVMSHLATVPTTGVTLRVDGPANARSEVTTAFPPNLVPVMAGREEGERSTSKLALKWLNNTGAAVTNAQVNYAAALKQLTTADKVMRGLPLDATDQALQKKFQIYNQGLRPLSLEEMQDRIWRRTILDEDFLTATVTAGPTPVYIPQYTVPKGTVVVLHSLAASIPSGSVGNTITLTIARDTQQHVVEVLLDNAAGLQTIWPLWIAATQSFQVVYQAQTTTDNVSFRLGWYRVKITGLLSVVLGQSDPRELTGVEKDLWEKLRAGVIA